MTALSWRGAERYTPALAEPDGSVARRTDGDVRRFEVLLPAKFNNGHGVAETCTVWRSCQACCGPRNTATGFMNPDVFAAAALDFEARFMIAGFYEDRRSEQDCNRSATTFQASSPPEPNAANPERVRQDRSSSLRCGRFT